MIRVRIDLLPGGDAKRAREIGCMYIANDGDSDDPSRGDYQVAVCRRGHGEVPNAFDWNPGAVRATRTGTVRNYPRLSYNVWRLITRALLSAFPEERLYAKNRLEDPTTADPEPIS